MQFTNYKTGLIKNRKNIIKFLEYFKLNSNKIGYIYTNKIIEIVLKSFFYAR